MKTGIAVLLAVLCLFASVAFAEGSFDLSLFENDPDFSYSEDIGLIGADMVMGMLMDGYETRQLFCFPYISTGKISMFPPGFILIYYYMPGTAIEPMKCEIDTGKTTYGCEHSGNSAIPGTLSNGDITETVVMVLDGQSLQLIAEIVNNALDDVRISFTGNRTVYGHLFFTDDNREKLAKLYNTYVLAGGLN